MTQTCACGKRQAPVGGGCGCGGGGRGGCGGGGGCGCGGGSRTKIDPNIKDRSEGRPQLDIRSGI